VSTTQVAGYGTLEQVQVQGRNVALLLTEAGGHDIGRVEGVQETIGRMFGFY
jgi:abhydrolase domain-containing protein 12